MTPLLVGAGAGILALVLTPGAARLARRLGAVDHPGGRRRHDGTVPRLGGLGIGGSFLLGSAGVVAMVGADGLVADNPNALVLVRGLLLGSLVALAVGAWDDIRELGPGSQLAGQIAVGLVAVTHELWLQQFTNPITGSLVDLRAVFGGGAAGLAVVVGATLLWYAGFINTMNWLDGVDGLAASVTAVAAALFTIHMVSAFDQQQLALFPAVLAGACVGFLVYNLPPARVFMGSSGSMFLGFAAAALALLAPAKVATALLVMSVPIVDVAWQIMYRARRGQAPWIGDRGHLHHRLFDRGVAPRRVVALYASLAALLGAIAVATPPGLAAGRLKLAALAVVGTATVVGLWRLARDDLAMIERPSQGPGDT